MNVAQEENPDERLGFTDSRGLYAWVDLSYCEGLEQERAICLRVVVAYGVRVLFLTEISAGRRSPPWIWSVSLTEG